MKLNWNPPKIKPQAAKFISTPGYSFDVHFGRERTDGTDMPARPFIDTAVAETDFIEEFKTGLNQSGNINKAFEHTAKSLHEKIKANITDERWYWDRITFRRNQTVAGSPRDIKDTGELLEGQILEIE